MVHLRWIFVRKFETVARIWIGNNISQIEPCFVFISLYIIVQRNIFDLKFGIRSYFLEVLKIQMKIAGRNRLYIGQKHNGRINSQFVYHL